MGGGGGGREIASEKCNVKVIFVPSSVSQPLLSLIVSLFPSNLN